MGKRKQTERFNVSEDGVFRRIPDESYWGDSVRKEKYRQVELKQFSVVEQGDVVARLVTHIPSKFAVLHKELYVEDEPGVWKVTWVALEDVEMLPDVHFEIKKHRQNTGDSLPKESGSKMPLYYHGE